MKRSSHWTCRRRVDGRLCMTRNPNRRRKCEACGGPKPERRRPKHLVALELPYDHYIELNGGDRCAICLRERTEKDKKLQRDHDHRTGQARGLLCAHCNRFLHGWMTPSWLRAAADYLEQRGSGRAA